MSESRELIAPVRAWVEKAEVDVLLTLNRYPVEARYPGDWEPMSRHDAEEAVGVARKLRATVRGLLPRDCLES